MEVNLQQWDSNRSMDHWGCGRCVTVPVLPPLCKRRTGQGMVFTGSWAGRYITCEQTENGPPEPLRAWLKSSDLRYTVPSDGPRNGADRAFIVDQVRLRVVGARCRWRALLCDGSLIGVVVWVVARSFAGNLRELDGSYRFSSHRCDGSGYGPNDTFLYRGTGA